MQAKKKKEEKNEGMQKRWVYTVCSMSLLERVIVSIITEQCFYTTKTVVFP